MGASRKLTTNVLVLLHHLIDLLYDVPRRLILTCFTTTLSTITTLLTLKPYFSPFHLVVADDDNSNMRFFRKFSLRRRLIILKCLSLSRQFEIIECFNSSILVILHSLFVSFLFLFDLNNDILSYIRFKKDEKKHRESISNLVRTCFDRKWSNTSTRKWDKKKRRCHAEKNDCENKKSIAAEKKQIHTKKDVMRNRKREKDKTIKKLKKISKSKKFYRCRFQNSFVSVFSSLQMKATASEFEKSIL